MKLSDFSTQVRRRNVSLFAELLKTPATGSVTLPAGGRFAIQASVDTQPASAAVVTGPADRDLDVPAMVANDIHVIDWLERASVVTMQPGFNLLLDTGLSEFHVVCKSG